MDLQTGDVLLMCGDAKRSDYLAKAQRLLYKKAQSSHVLFSFGDGAFVHSTPDAGVAFTNYLEVLKDCKDGWRVIRMKHLTGSQREAMQKASIFLLDQSYNRKFFFESNDSSSFCSELIAKIFDVAEIKLFEKKTGSVTPADFDKAADSNDMWIDVTEEYKKGFDELAQMPREFAIAYSTLVLGVKKRQRMLGATDTIMDLLKGLAQTGDVSENLYNQALAMETEFRKNKQVSFWNERKYPDLTSEADKDDSDPTATK